MTDAITSSPFRAQPLMAGKFGERSLADRLGDVAHRPAGCPSVEQFEARMTTAGERRRDRIA
ncbi:MAG: hypothetical protein JSS55_02365 [Proteobacteria bacterium]|nr:hypothetical protein [Pseudomonadota bacterium]